MHRLATELALNGHVGNDTGGVFIEIEGTSEATEEFVQPPGHGRSRCGPH